MSSAKDLSIISIVQSVPKYQNEEFLRELYLQKQLSIGQIAGEIRSARSTIKEALRHFKIPLRSEDEARRLSKGQLAFGEKLVSGKILPHKSELRVLQKILDLRKSGATYDAIAAWLNSECIPTKNGASEWKRPTIFKIVKKSTKIESDFARLAARSSIH